jgi:cyclophilin family peptidyl-prolyl cis-trans isomerase
MHSTAPALSRFSFIEPLEARIAPAVVVINPLADLVAGSGKTGATVDLSNLFNEAVDNPNRTLVQFITNFDIDPNTAGVQPGIIQLELFDDVTPLTVQNFLTYVNNKNARGDYDDTFIHRSFDFQSNNSNDIIQGGGFETTNVREHIPTGFEVHNEYVLPNTRGTIAMAKTALSPNTATSEWFFNVNNNSSILGPENNGGFTVFGRVISGMEVVDAIAALPKVNASGALTDLPVQNLTGGGQPTASNLVSITDAAVLPREAGNTSGISFQVVGVTDAESGAASTLVNATIVGGKTLDLKYATNQSGVANVTIRAFKDGEFVDETFCVTVKPNLIANITDDLLPSAVVPGELTKAKIRLANNGAATLNGSFDVKFYLSKLIPGVDSQGTTFDAGDILIGQLAGQQLSILGGASKTLTAQLAIPAELVQGNTSAYKLIAQVTPVGTAPNELFTDDNNALDGDRHALTNQFGTFKTTAFIGQQALDFGERSNVTLSYLNAAGDTGKLSVKGSGSGQISQRRIRFAAHHRHEPDLAGEALRR